MNNDGHILKRLLKAATKAQRETPAAMPFALEARVLAGWRASAPEEVWSGMVGYFRRAVACAVLHLRRRGRGRHSWAANVRIAPGAACGSLH